MKTARIYVTLLMGASILNGYWVIAFAKTTAIDVEIFAEKMWTGKSTLEEGLEELALIPADQLPQLLAALFLSPHSNPEGLDITFGLIVSEFSKRMDAAKWREIVSVILTDDEYPKNLKVTIARTRYHAEIMDNDVESIIDMLEDAVKPVDKVWVYAQRGIASALISSHSAAFRKTGAKTIRQVESVAEKQMRSIMPDLLILGTKEDTLYQYVTAKTLATYCRIVPKQFEEQLIKSFAIADLGVANELRILESMYRNPSFSPSESGPVRKYIRELEDKAELQQLQISEQDRIIIDLIVAE